MDLPISQGPTMDRIEHVFATLSHRMTSMSVPDRPACAPEPLTCLIAKVNAAKRMYEPGLRQRGLSRLD